MHHSQMRIMKPPCIVDLYFVLSNQCDGYFLADCAPLWLFHFGPQDLVEIRRKPVEAASEDSILLKVFIPEQSASSTIKFHSMMTVDEVVKALLPQPCFLKWYRPSTNTNGARLTCNSIQLLESIFVIMDFTSYLLPKDGLC